MFVCLIAYNVLAGLASQGGVVVDVMGSDTTGRLLKPKRISGVDKGTEQCLQLLVLIELGGSLQHIR